jgi:hypothetical protein
MSLPVKLENPMILNEGNFNQTNDLISQMLKNQTTGITVITRSMN